MNPRVGLLSLIFAIISLVGFAGCAQFETPPISVWLEVPSEARLGEAIPIKLRVKNISSQSVSLRYQEFPQFTVTTALGMGVWSRHQESPLFPPSQEVTIEQDHMYRFEVLKAGQELIVKREVVVRDLTGERVEIWNPFEVKWNQLNNKGRPLRPGTYSIRGMFSIRLPAEIGNTIGNHQKVRVIRLTTAPKRLIILR